MGLSSTEWRNAIKLQGNLAPVKALHGWSQQNSHYKHSNERDSLPHVLGFCYYEELLRSNWHHLIRIKIAAGVKMNTTQKSMKKFTASLPTAVTDEQIFLQQTIVRNQDISRTPLYDLIRMMNSPWMSMWRKEKFINLPLATLKVHIS